MIRDAMCYTFTEPPTGDAYRELVDFCCAIATRVCLVVRDPDRKRSESIAAKLSEFEAYQEKAVRARKWPGTILYGHDALVYWYRVDRGLSGLLQKSASELYDWVHPDRPEDLCFFRADYSVVLTTVSQEKDAYLTLLDEEFSRLGATCPLIVPLLRMDGSAVNDLGIPTDN